MPKPKRSDVSKRAADQEKERSKRQRQVQRGVKKRTTIRTYTVWDMPKHSINENKQQNENLIKDSTQNKMGERKIKIKSNSNKSNEPPKVSQPQQSNRGLN